MTMRILEVFRNCAKVLLLVLNSFCILVALTTLGFAAADTRIVQQYGAEQAAGTVVGDVIIMAASFLLLMVATFGCIGAIRESAQYLYLYAGFLMILVVLELMTGMYVGLQRYGLEVRITDWLRDDFFSNTTDEDLHEHLKLWDDLQTNFECCGLNGPEDYVATQQSISVSCCPRAYRARTVLAKSQLYNACIESQSYNQEGCEDEILRVLRDDADWLLGIAVTSFWFEAAGISLATWMGNNIRNSVKVYKHTVKY